MMNYSIKNSRPSLLAKPASILTILLFALLVTCIFAQSSKAQTNTYAFDPNQSTIAQTGGIAGLNRTYTIEGQFQLSMDFEAGTAAFEKVDANAVDDSPYRRSLDPNEVFAMTTLTGVVLSETALEFTGYAADGSSVLVKMTIADSTITIKAQTTPPPNSADFFIFSMDAVAHRKYAGGTGEPNNPFLLYTAEQMNTIGACPDDWDKHFKLMADIDLSIYTGTEFNIIGYGRSRSDKKPFRGVFDGNNKKISNFNYISINAGRIGLFGYMDGEHAQIRNLILQDPNVGSVTGRYIGALVGDANGYINGCYVQGGNVWGDHIVGSITGCNRGIINDCASSSTVSGTGYVVGGLVGSNPGTISDCYSSNNVWAEGYVGGLIGSNNGLISKSFATGSVQGDVAGGLVGFVGSSQSANIIQCYSTGDVLGYNFLGAFVGLNSGGKFTNCYATGSTSGSEFVGGLVGLNLGTVFNCYATGSVTGDSWTGGLIGIGHSVYNSFWDIESSGQMESAGGMGKTTAEMQAESTFTDAGWDFVGETANGTEDIWWILEGQDYPRLWWELTENDVNNPNEN
jgi:hypothetical protein